MSSDRVRILISSDGYRYLCDGHPSDDDAAVVSEHRLAAVAWGILDGLDDPREVDHVDRSPTLTAEGNLVALSRDDHVERTVERAVREGRTPPAWALASMPAERRERLVDGDGELREDADRVVGGVEA